MTEPMSSPGQRAPSERLNRSSTVIATLGDVTTPVVIRRPSRAVLLTAIAVLTATALIGLLGARAFATSAARDAACVALTGTSSCDWTQLTPCPQEDGGPVLPCAWIASRDGNRQGTGVHVYLAHECPPLRGATCSDVRDQ